MPKVKARIEKIVAEIKVPFHLKYWPWCRLSLFIGIDILIIATSYWAAFALRLEDVWPEQYIATLLRSLLFLEIISLLVFTHFGMYRQVWRFANFNSGLVITKSVIVSSIVGYLTTLMFPLSVPIPRSVPVIYALIAIAATTAVRFSWRAIASFQSRYNAGSKSRCLIYGAGSGGDILVRHIKANPGFPYFIVGLVDDDPNKRKRRFHDFTILGTGEELKSICETHTVDSVLIAMPSASGKALRTIVKRCLDAGVKPLNMPGLTSTLTEEIIKPRPIDVGDLLRRMPKEVDRQKITDFFTNESVLITGAGGSIGSEIARQIYRCNPRVLILLDSCEYNLYRIELELRESNSLNFVKLIPILGSVIDERLVKTVFEQYRPKIVLHAAAYKHVPMLEANPIEGIVNNVLGTLTCAEAAIEFGTTRFLLISTDKAVRPTNIMGATKRACELLIQALHDINQNHCSFCAVRFGNVLGSSGSVIPLFLEQISRGGPVTVTHPDVTRFFMLVSEAVGLVLQSAVMSSGGETFVLNMGEPVKIYEMAEQLIRLAGKEPGKDIDIVVTGLRPGEKLYEELILEGSEQHTLHDDVFVAIPQKIHAELILTKVRSILSSALAGQSEVAIRELRKLADTKPSAQQTPRLEAEPLH